jgi:MFS family permease
MSTFPGRSESTGVGAVDAAIRGKPTRRLALSKRSSFWAAAVIAFLPFAANAAASPLYRVYQAQFRFSATTLTLLFAVYIVVLLVTLLFLGSLSDHVGRRPVMLVGLAIGALACGLFLVANGIGLLFAARALQGVAGGLMAGGASAALLDLRPHSSVAPLVSSAAATGGQALGAIGASVLAQYAPAPTHLVWYVLLAAFVAGIFAVLAMGEPGTVRPGMRASLRPHVSVPPAARGAFAAAVPCLIGVWALGGFYLSLGPSLAAQLLRSANLLWGGALIFVLTGLGAAASSSLVDMEPVRVMVRGCVALTAGALVTFAAIETGTPAVLFVGTAIAGLGFGPAFMGAYRAAVARAPSDDRAGLVTAIYIVSYLATAIPAVIGGVATSHYGLHDTALVYSLAVAALAAGAVILLIRRTDAAGDPDPAGRYPGPPPGPCTVPPCPPPRRGLNQVWPAR